MAAGRRWRLTRWIVWGACWGVLAARGGEQPYFFTEMSMPDTPGAVAPERIAAARARLPASVASAPGLEFVAGGIAFGNPYAVFATPFVQVDKRIESRTRAACVMDPGISYWNCHGPHTEVQVRSTAGLQSFIFSDPRLAGEIVDYLYSSCLAAQYQSLTNRPLATSVAAESINAVVASGNNAFDVHTGSREGGGTFYLLARTGTSSDRCLFQLQRTGPVMSQAQAVEEIRQKQRGADAARFATEQARQGQVRNLAETGLTASIICAVLALFVPLGANTLYGPRGGATAAGALSAAATLLFIFSAAYGPHYETPLHMLIVPPLLLLDWLLFVGLAAGATAGAADSPGRRLLRRALYGLGALLLLALVGFIALIIFG